MVNARASLADALRRSGKLDAAIAEYVEIVKIDPSASEARFGHAMALVRLASLCGGAGRARGGRRACIPNNPVSRTRSLALLASAPDDAVRDGPRALAIMQSLEKTTTARRGADRNDGDGAGRERTIR